MDGISRVSFPRRLSMLAHSPAQLGSLLMLGISCLGLPAAIAERPTRVIQQRCLGCHSREERSGGVDLSVLLGSTSADDKKHARLWNRVEKMVAREQMPPADEDPLSKSEREAVLRWYRTTYVLRDGKDHIGVTPLRRLTRYELENTLEDLLAVQLKRPYVFSPESQGLLPSTIEQLYPADVPGDSGYDNDALQMGKSKVPVLKYMECLDYALRVFDQNAEARRQVLGFSDKPKSMSEKAARRALTRFLDRAGRGYRNTEERDRVFQTWRERAKTSTAYAGILHAMKVALLSPGFLFRMETARDKDEPYLVSAHELAVRLSYFLWASMPDAALVKSASDGSLLRKEVLLEQVRRMLDAPRRIALAENFAGQWLGFDELKRNKVFYHGELWTRGVYDELLFGFDELVRSDRSVLEVVDADWMYLRRGQARRVKASPYRLAAKHADIFAARRSRAGLKVERFYDPPRLYKTESSRVGGLLTAAGIMRLTSAPKRTSPIRRGVWILERIIGEKMHPPANIPPLAESEKKLDPNQASSPAAILKVHTARASCRVCHKHIDPLGLGLENFSPRGEWRTSYQDKSRVVSRGKLPNGRDFTSPRQLKKELLAFYKDRITENIIRQMLAYAIGRKLQPYDRVTVEKIKQALTGNDFRMSVLIEQIILSKQFRFRQDRI